MPDKSQQRAVMMNRARDAFVSLVQSVMDLRLIMDTDEGKNLEDIHAMKLWLNSIRANLESIRTRWEAFGIAIPPDVEQFLREV